jgi:hypothetical protein
MVLVFVTSLDVTLAYAFGPFVAAGHYGHRSDTYDPSTNIFAYCKFDT